MNQQLKSSELIHLEQITGLRFILIPAGTYKVGLAADKAKLALNKESVRYYEYYLSETEIELPAFWIADDLLRLSHWQKLQQSPLAEALNSVVQPYEIADYQSNYIKDIQYGHDFGWKRFDKDIVETDPALTLTFPQALNLVRTLGGNIPNWAEWEVAARGKEAYLYPWGNEFNLNKVELSYQRYSYTWSDDESIMGLCRETSYISGRKCRIDSFGEYENAISPFGLKGLVHWGKEWNTTAIPLTDPGHRDIDSHLLRSICDLGHSGSIVNLSEYESENKVLRASNHRAFSGTSLAMFAPPDRANVAAFRLVYPLAESNN